MNNYNLFQLRATLRVRTAANAFPSTGVSVQWNSEVFNANTVSYYIFVRLQLCQSNPIKKIKSQKSIPQAKRLVLI
jgi:hypothetical protein